MNDGQWQDFVDARAPYHANFVAQQKFIMQASAEFVSYGESDNKRGTDYRKSAAFQVYLEHS